MDPNKCLEEIRYLRNKILDDDNIIDTDSLIKTSEELAEKLYQLDNWITKGGFLPKQWQK